MLWLVRCYLGEKGGYGTFGRNRAHGAQAGEAKLREVITAGGFPSVRRATGTPFNMILGARP
jgi:hypothetical protein